MSNVEFAIHPTRNRNPLFGNGKQTRKAILSESNMEESTSFAPASWSYARDDKEKKTVQNIIERIQNLREEEDEEEEEEEDTLPQSSLLYPQKQPLVHQKPLLTLASERPTLFENTNYIQNNVFSFQFSEPLVILLQPQAHNDKYVANSDGVFPYEKKFEHFYGSPVRVAKRYALSMTQIMLSFVGQSTTFSIVVYSYNTITGKIQQHGKTNIELVSSGVVSKEIDMINDELKEGVYKFFIGIISTQPINGTLNTSLKFRIHADYSSRFQRHFGNALKERQRMYSMTAIQESEM
jgi:hypothetical protein